MVLFLLARNANELPRITAIFKVNRQKFFPLSYPDRVRKRELLFIKHSKREKMSKLFFGHIDARISQAGKDGGKIKNYEKQCNVKRSNSRLKVLRLGQSLFCFFPFWQMSHEKCVCCLPKTPALCMAHPHSRKISPKSSTPRTFYSSASQFSQKDGGVGLLARNFHLMCLPKVLKGKRRLSIGK